MATSRKGYGNTHEAFAPQEVAELLGDLMKPEDSVGYRAVKIIKWARKHNLGKHYDISIGRWEFSRQDVDTLRRLIEEDAAYTFSTKDVEELTGLTGATIVGRAKRMGLGRKITDALPGDPVMFTADEVEQIKNFVSRKGDHIRNHYAVDDDALTVTKVADMLKPDFPALTILSIQDKIRRAANNGVAGTHDPQKNMWLFSPEDVDTIRQSMQAKKPAGRGGRPVTKTNLR